MDSERKIEIVSWILIIGLNIFCILTKAYSDVLLAFIIADAIFVYFLIIPKVIKSIRVKKMKRKLDYAEGEIYDIIECYEMFIYKNSNSPEDRRYPVIKFYDKDMNENIVICDQVDPDEYEIGQRIRVWYQKGKNERRQCQGNVFLGETYNKIIISDKVLEHIDDSMPEKELIIYSYRFRWEFNGYPNTNIKVGKNILIEKSI